MITAVDDFHTTLKTLSKPIDMVLKYPPGPKRWRAAHELLWKNLSWKNQQIYTQVVEENRITRESVDKHGRALGLTGSEMADKTLRTCLNIPVGAMHVIEKVDPHLFATKANERKFFNEFKEYSTRETY